MPQTVDIAGFGKVNFPDNFTPDQINEAIERDIVPNLQGTAFQKANAKLEAGGQVGFRADQKPGQEFVPGSYDTGGAPRRPKLYEAPQPAPEGNLGAAIKDSFAADEGTRLRLIADSLFPGDPKGIERVGIRNGKPVFVNDEGKLQYVSGTKSNILGGLIGNSPEIIGGILGSFTPNPVTGSALGAMGGKTVKRAISKLVFDEPATPETLATELSIEGATNLAGSGAGKLVGKFADRGRVVDFSPRQLSQAEATREAVKQRTGIDLDLAQASGDRRLIRLRDYAGRYPGETAQMIQAADEAASGQFDAATKRVLDLVSRASPADTQGVNAINAAKETIEIARAAVRQQARPLYDAAYAGLPVVTDPALLNYLKIPYFAPALRAGRKIQAIEDGVEATKQFLDNPRISLKDLDYLKRGLDQQIKSLESSGARGIRGQEASALREKKNQFIAQLDSLSNQQYQVARQAYAQGMAAQVNPLEEGFVGILAKLDPIDAPIASKIFNDASITPQQIALLKSKISQTNPDAYEGLVRQYLSNAYNTARKETRGADVVNAPGRFRNLIADSPDQRDNLKAILPAGALQDLDDLLVAAQSLAKTPLGASRVAGSNTYGDQALGEVLRGRAVAVLKALTTPRQALREAAELRAQEQGVKELTEALLDPAKRGQLRRILRMKDSTRQLYLLGGLLGGQAIAGEASNLTENVSPAQ